MGTIGIEVASRDNSTPAQSLLPSDQPCNITKRCADFQNARAVMALQDHCSGQPPHPPLVPVIPTHRTRHTAVARVPELCAGAALGQCAAIRNVCQSALVLRMVKATVKDGKRSKIVFGIEVPSACSRAS